MSEEIKKEEIVETAPDQAPVEQVAEKSEADVLREQLEVERILRESAEEERDNAKKDIIAMRSKKKRKDVELPDENEEDEDPAPVEDKTKEYEEKLAAAKKEAEDAKKRAAELARIAKSRTAAAPIGGSARNPSPAPAAQSPWTEEQKAYLRNVKGMSDASIERAGKNLLAGAGQRNHQFYGFKKRDY